MTLSVYRLTWRLPLAGLVAFSHLQFSQIRGRQPYLIVRKILYVICWRACCCNGFIGTLRNLTVPFAELQREWSFGVQDAAHACGLLVVEHDGKIAALGRNLHSCRQSSG